jgi:hypothetical protein
MELLPRRIWAGKVSSKYFDFGSSHKASVERAMPSFFGVKYFRIIFLVNIIRESPFKKLLTDVLIFQEGIIRVHRVCLQVQRLFFWFASKRSEIGLFLYA